MANPNDTPAPTKSLMAGCQQEPCCASSRPAHGGYPGTVIIGEKHARREAFRRRQRVDDFTRFMLGVPDGYTYRHQFGRGYVIERGFRGGPC